MMALDRRKFLKNTGATMLGAAVTVKAANKPAPAEKARSRRGKRVILTDQAPKPGGPYSQAIVAGSTIYVSGQTHINPRTGNVVVGAFEEQAVLVFENLQAVLKAAGVGLQNAVKVNIYLADLSNFSKLNEVYRRYFSAGDFPARTTVGAQLASGLAMEVDCIAVR